MNSLEKAKLTSWCNKQALDMQSFIKTWPYKGCSEFDIGEYKFDFSKRRTRSHGGLSYHDGIWTPFINIAMHYYIHPVDVYRFYEYKSYDDDKVIGGFYSNDNEHRIMAVICHEMAHAIQYWRKFYCGLQNVKPHGEEFKKYYAILRQVYVNSKLPDQEEYGKKYRNLKKIAIFQELGPINRAA